MSKGLYNEPAGAWIRRMLSGIKHYRRSQLRQPPAGSIVHGSFAPIAARSPGNGNLDNVDTQCRRRQLVNKDFSKVSCGPRTANPGARNCCLPPCWYPPAPVASRSWLSEHSGRRRECPFSWPPRSPPFPEGVPPQGRNGKRIARENDAADPVRTHNFGRRETTSRAC
jgi:hypothetical protein